MLVNEYKPEFYVRKVRKMRNLGNVYICGSPFVMSRTDAQNGLDSIFNISATTLYPCKHSKKLRFIFLKKQQQQQQQQQEFDL